MPLYEIHHSYPLNGKQRTQLAQAITHLHSTTFLTPSMFVHVKYHAEEASDNNHFLAGKSLHTAANRIVGMVRQSSSRSKADFDKLAEKIEEAWYETVSGSIIEEGKDQGKRQSEVNDSAIATAAKKLSVVAFYGMVTARENGHDIPTAGEEAAWFKAHKQDFEKRAAAGDQLYQDLLDEVDQREDLKKAYTSNSA